MQMIKGTQGAAKDSPLRTFFAAPPLTVSICYGMVALNNGDIRRPQPLPAAGQRSTRWSNIHTASYLYLRIHSALACIINARDWEEWGVNGTVKMRNGTTAKTKTCSEKVRGCAGGSEWGGDIVKQSSTSERRTEDKGATRGGIAWGLRGSIKYFNHRSSCYKNAFDPDSKALL